MLGKRFELILHKNTQPSQNPFGELSSIALAMLTLALNEPNRPAFCNLSTEDIEGQQWFSWGQIANWVCDACVAIESTNLPTGTHLATVENNSVEWFVLDFACQALGYVHVAIDHRWPDPMIARLIEQSQSQVVYNLRLATSSNFGQLENVITLDWQLNWKAPSVNIGELDRLIERAMSISKHQPAQMLFTSGTSGEPKGVLLSHRNLVSNAFAKLEAAPQYAQDLRLNILPFCHAYARTCELSTWVLSKSRLAIANGWNDFIRQARELQPTLINLVPHLASKLLHHEKSKQQLAPSEIASRLGGKVRLLQVGGAPLPDDLWYELDKSGLPPLQGYGLTEASPVVCSNRAGKQRPGTIGPPVAGVELRVDALGQLWVRGDGIMLGYYGDQAATQARIEDGWLATGDLVERDEFGHYRLKGRISEFVVLSTGRKVTPELIEGRLENIGCIDRALIAGEDRPHIVALIWPAWSNLPSSLFADDSRDYHSLDLGAFHRLLADLIHHALADLPYYVHPRKFIVVCESMDSSLVTPKGSLRRKLAISRYRSQIDNAYSVTPNICDTSSS